ncbi:MAG: sigma factor-like helix-turn-helix DNA-binding protein [Mycoplasma sp.]
MNYKKINLKIIENAINNIDENFLVIECFEHVKFLGEIVVYKIMSKNFNNIPLEKEDFNSLIYYAMIDTLRWFNTTNEDPRKFAPFFSVKVKQLAINHCRSFSSKRHSVLNFYQEYEQGKCESFETITNFERSNNTKIKIEEIANILTGIQKKIFILRLKGFDNEDIAKELSIPINRVRYEIIKIRKNDNILSILK